MRGVLKDMAICLDWRQQITVIVKADFREQFDALSGKDLDIEIKQHREKRSKSANAYFHVLVNKIAAETFETDEEVKTRLVCDYGTVAKDPDGMSIGFKLPANVDVRTVNRYTRRFDTRIENGREFACYLLLKPTHEMNTKEMSRLIDGAIMEAKELGIETDTPEQLARYKMEWEAYEQEHHADRAGMLGDAVNGRSA